MRTWHLRLAVLFCILTVALAVLVPGTYAWESKQKARNDVYGIGVEKIPVVLIKQEKLEDGTYTDKMIPNTAFYLFEEDGTQIGGLYLTDEKGEIHVVLNPGNYYFEETIPSMGYTYDQDENGESVIRYPFTVTSLDLAVKVHAYNLPLSGELLIRKTVENTDGMPLSEFQKKLSFPFVVTFSDGGSYNYKIDGVNAGTLESGNVIHLTHGQTASFEGLPRGLLYNVKEQAPEGYVVSSLGHQGNITEEPAVAAFLNRVDPEKTGSLTVSKTVEGNGADPEQEFQFTVTVGEVTESFALKAGEQRTISGLLLGTAFTVTEADVEGYQAQVQTYSGQIVSHETVELPFINICELEPGTETGSLIITKEVRGYDHDPSTEFAFSIRFSGENAPQDQSFTLRDGKSVTFPDLPLGTEYVVTEEELLPDGYVATVREYVGQIASEEALVLPFVNVYDPAPEGKVGSLAITKTVTGELPNVDSVFTFHVSFFGENAPKSEYFTLRAGEIKVIENIPHGVIYIVEETDAVGYEAAVQRAHGVISGNQEAKVQFINAAPERPGTETGSLIVGKIVKGENVDPSKKFTFTVAFGGTGAPASENFTLAAGENKLFEDIPDGVTYTVTETDAAGYEAVLETVDGTIRDGRTAEVCFTNVSPSSEPPEEQIRLTVTKHVLGDGADPDKAFRITLVAGDITNTFVLKDGETIEFTVPEGIVYEVREDNYITEGYRQNIEHGYGIASGDVAVIVTNTYEEAVRVEISGTKSWDLSGCEDDVLPEAITVRLMNEELLVEEQTVIPDEKGDWRYAFTAPKFNADGKEIAYEVEEAPVDGFRASYDGFDITNTYIPQVKVEIPMITKKLEGDKAPETEFSFVLRGKTGYPMPEGSDGYQCMASITDEGQASFGSISFSEPGEYSYIIYEVNERLPGWEYDAAIYTVVFTVIEEEAGLVCTYEIKRNHISVDEIAFINCYTKVDLTETVEISGKKIWYHRGNAKKDRPEYVIVQIYGDGKFVMDITVTEKDDWTYAVELPKYKEDGRRIVYTIDEVDVEDYIKVIDGFDLINTYVYAPSDPDAPVPDTPGAPGTPDGPDDIPHTGDDANLPLWISLMVLSAVGLITTLLTGRKPRYKGKYVRRR